MIDTGAKRPIGYWLKKLDRLIDGQFERQLGDAGLSRRQWQVLNLLQDGPRSVPELHAELEPFLQEAPDELDDAAAGLLSRGWADSQDAVISLTETGVAQFGLVTAKIAELRQHLVAGISPEDYRATIDVLVRMVANLESDAGSGFSGVSNRSGIEKQSHGVATSLTAIDITTTTSGVTVTGSSTQGIKTVLHPVSDLATAKDFYTALLGVSPQTDGPYYVGFEAAGQQIGLVPGGGPQGMTSPVAYWHVPDIEAKLAEVAAAGATVKEPAHDVGGGRLVATVTDPDGNVLGLIQDR